MRPQWGLHYVSTPRVGAEIMICLDVSKSMLAEDVAPNRLERAKAEIRDLLYYLDGDHVGLIAFAGRASVIAPLTPDFGFLRLVLDGVGVRSVTRGGTRLEEPIRKAVGDVSRAILLITDGEDHDSFPLDAAKAAAEVGIRIIPIGFGDEAGSEVTITDPETGARTRLRDSSGSIVRSRLDGETLREIALVTAGAYIPAGTGALDLASIYRTHIERLTRGLLTGRGKAVRQEGYQWAVLLGLVSLVLSIGVARRASRSVPVFERELGRKAAAFLALGVLVASTHAGAQTPEPGAEPAQATERSAPLAPAGEPEQDPPEDPRQIYNRGLAAFDEGHLEDGEAKLQAARSTAADDAELRYRATYNLGYYAAKRADELVEGEPEQALRRLYAAADWFREAVRLRPEAEDPRHNLDVVLERALVLADALAQRDPSDWAAALEALASEQRALVGDLRGTVEQIGPDEGPDVVEELRREFRGLAATQRGLLSDADGLAERVGTERDALLAKSEQERSPEEAIRLTQLQNLLHYLHRGRERMGHARSRLRRHQAERAYRRASAALAELRRAQDQLRNPVEVLDKVIQDAVETTRESALLAATRTSLPDLEAQPAPPGWLTLDYLRERQQSVEERTAELHARLQAGLAAGDQEAADENSARLLAMVREAAPFVEAGRHAFERARQALEQDDLEEAGNAQREAIAALLDARERFLDLRGLIETAYADEVIIRRLLSPENEEAAVPLVEILPGLRSLQAKNIGRGERLDGMLQVEQSRVEAGADAAQAEELEAQRERLTAAGEILDATRAAMEAAQRGLGASDSAMPNPEDLTTARAAVERAATGLEVLRRLFFSIVEHLRETARRQLELNDQTQDVATLLASAPESAAARLGPLLPRQKELAQTASAIAEALEAQSRQSVAALVDDPNSPAGADAEAQEASERLRRAGELVLGAQADMEGAVLGLEAEPPEPGPARERQDTALAQLVEAIALLTPPPSQDCQQADENAQESRGASQQAQAEQGQASAAPTPSGDPAQLLQAVRDRAAQRQRERAERSRYETVEKDW
jgi:Ca-activated chloride channel family protein